MINRFEFCGDGESCYKITDIETFKEYNEYDLEELCDLLNALHNENKKLRKEIASLQKQ